MRPYLFIRKEDVCKSAVTSVGVRTFVSPLWQCRMSSSNNVPSPFVLKLKYADFKKVQASREPFDSSLPVITTRSPNPQWKYGSELSSSASLSSSHIEIDPFAQDRRMIFHYKLLKSGIPRPISFVSTVSKTGEENLAPFSYFQVVDHDPPTFVVGFSVRASRPKDTRRSLEETVECMINIVSEQMFEAVNAISLDVPHGISEWGLSGLTPERSSIR